MRLIRWISAIMTLAGIALVAGALAFSPDPMWTLVGLLLFWAGIVKVIVVAIWRNLGAPETPAAPER